MGSPGATDDEITIRSIEHRRSRNVMGTLAYMSPEQARGLELDHRTDIFSLGIVLYHMVAGELPFGGPHAASILDKILFSPVPSLRLCVHRSRNRWKRRLRARQPKIRKPDSRA